MPLNFRLTILSLLLALAGIVPLSSVAQNSSSGCSATNISENFTGLQTTCQWNWIGGACLTAAPAGATTSPGPLPQCIGSAYYGNQTQYGGNSEQTGTAPGGTLNNYPDTPLKGGALRLTNDADNQAGAIISTSTFNLAQNGVFVSFTTETYEGDSGGTNKDGADGISFFLQDASQPVTLGDFGGSLGYTCSNSNNSSTQGYDGMVGGYIGLGIDEYGNFLNGSFYTNTTGASPTLNSTGADNTSTGYGYVPNRIGLRGAGSTAWYSLSKILDPITGTAYYPSTLSSAQRIAAVRQACQSGYVWDYRNATSTITGPTSPSNNGNVVTWENPYSATKTTTTIPNYAAIPNAYTVLTAHKIANEAALYRGYANAATSGPNYGVPITYNLSITPPSGTQPQPLLSLSYSYNGGNFLPIISGQALPVSNGALPAQVRFGFAGSTGGSRNIHEIMCFTAQPQNSASSSAGLNQKQSAKVQTGSQVYFAFYNSNNWTGDVTAQSLYDPDSNPNDLAIEPIPNWSASCNLTGGPCPKTGVPVTAQDPDNGRVIISWNPVLAAGVAFRYPSLSSGEQSNLDFGDSGIFPPLPSSRVEFLRGARGDEQNPQGVDPNTPTVNPSGFRARTSVLGDIVDSSPTWVGPPQSSFPTQWRDSLNTGVSMPENSGTSYASFQSTFIGRTNVVYTGANDGLLHGFRSGNFAAGATAGTMTYQPANNDGREVIAYMPGYVVNSINSSTLANTLPATSNPVNDYSNPLYAHKFNVDGTPGTGDLFYGGTWHTWLVGGLGTGGNAIYALDITDPDGIVSSNKSFSEANASNIVLGEWQSSINYSTTTNATTGVTSTVVTGGSSTITCAGNGSAASTCGNSLGKTFGTPLIRRFHNNPSVAGSPNTSWGVVFGNGGGSFNGDAGIFIMMVNASSSGALQAPTFYYLSTGVGTNYVAGTSGTYTNTGSNPNGIYYVAAADLDGDHITDYIYAGDLQGNIWRFDVTSTNPANWGVTQVSGAPTPIYTTAGGKAQPITTQPIVVTVASTPTSRVLVEFGTGQQTQFTNNSGATYSSSQQGLFGIWDWNMAAWNSNSTTQFASLPSSGTAAPTSTISGVSQLLGQTISGPYFTGVPAVATYRTVSSSVVCWAGTPGCSGSSAQYGWSLPLVSGYANSTDANNPTATTTTGAQMIYEQVIFSPTYQQGAIQVNTTLPPTSSVATCSGTSAGGWTMAINPATGGGFTSSYFATGNSAGSGGTGGTGSHTFLNVNGLPVTGIALNGTGSASDVIAGTQPYLVTQTINGVGAIVAINPPSTSGGKRLTWIQKR